MKKYLNGYQQKLFTNGLYEIENLLNLKWDNEKIPKLNQF